MDEDIHRAATKAWDEVVKLGEKNGYRNAQASVLAPTRTIGFMMDCDTTGIEPDFSLVKFKKLVGGGSMQIVNLTIPRALKKLGYQRRRDRGDRRVHRRQGHVIDAPGLKTEHYEVFDTAMGARAISPDGSRADDGGFRWSAEAAGGRVERSSSTARCWFRPSAARADHSFGSARRVTSRRVLPRRRPR